MVKSYSYNKDYEGSNDLVSQASPEPDTDCNPQPCEIVDGFCHISSNFEFDLSSCISPQPLSTCNVVLVPVDGICSFICTENNEFVVTIQEFPSFSILPDCLPQDYTVDMDCVVDQMIYQFMPSVLHTYSAQGYYEQSDAVYTNFTKQLCASYCTVWFPYPVVRIIPCEESFSCCKTETRWEKNTEGEWIPISTTSVVTGECSGPSPKCSSRGKFDGPSGTLPLSSTCEPRNCYQPQNY